MNKYGYGMLAATLMLCVPIWAGPSPAQKAFEARDIVALETLSHTAATADERQLALGAALAFRRKDAAAIAALTSVESKATVKDLRASALQAIAEVYLRQGRFADTAAALRKAQALSTAPFDSATLQTLDFAEAASHEKPMQVTHLAAGRLDVTRDAAGLIRVPIRINGGEQDVVIDSGAGFSTISESTAKRLGLRLIERATSVRSASKDSVATRIGIADKLQFGEAELASVPFIVLPDEALSFAGGRYKIDAIVGLPVFVMLERIAVGREGGKESLYYGPKPEGKGESNLLLAGVEPLALVHVDQAAEPLRMFIDTGAGKSTLNAKFVKDFPALAAAAIKHAARFEGAGGQRVDDDAKALPELKLSIAGRPVILKNVSILSKTEADRHGVIGQDVLKQGKRWVLDFAAMRFSIED
jgi:predicted aspartyl protease